MGSDLQVHAFEEVAKHNQKGDCWIIISGKVYDVTSFLDDHPGGDEVLLTATEKDATNDFEDVGHSDSAREMMDKYYMGEVDMSSLPVEQPPKQQPTIPPSGAPGETPGPGVLSKMLQFIIPLLILGLALAMYHFAKK